MQENSRFSTRYAMYIFLFPYCQSFKVTHQTLCNQVCKCETDGVVKCLATDELSSTISAANNQ